MPLELALESTYRTKRDRARCLRRFSGGSDVEFAPARTVDTRHARGVVREGCTYSDPAALTRGFPLTSFGKS